MVEVNPALFHAHFGFLVLVQLKPRAANATALYSFPPSFLHISLYLCHSFSAVYKSDRIVSKAGAGAKPSAFAVVVVVIIGRRPLPSSHSLPLSPGNIQSFTKRRALGCVKFLPGPHCFIAP